MEESGFRRGLRSALFTSSAIAIFAAQAGSDNAMAQEAAQAEEEEALEEIVVTGSRIARTGIDTLQPAVTVEAEFIDERGFDNVATALNEVPAFGLPGASSIGGGGGPGRSFTTNNIGQNFVNAFGIGSQRTLVLMNGRRVVGANAPATSGGAAAGLQVDLNVIPTALIERVETVFVGGAPIYGTDAIGGTVNLIMKDDYQGFEVDSQFGISQRGDAEEFRIRGLWGGNFADGRGNAVLTAEFSLSEGVRASDRDFVRLEQPGFCDNTALQGGRTGEWLGINGLADDDLPDQVLCIDGATVFQVPNTGIPLTPFGSLFFQTDPEGPFTPGQEDVLVNENGERVLFNAAGDLVPFETIFKGGVQDGIFFMQGIEGGGSNTPELLSLDEVSLLRFPLDRWQFGGIAHYDINDNVTAFAETLFARSESVDDINQPIWNTLFFGPGAAGLVRLNINDNPFVQNDPRLLELLELNGVYDPNAPDEITNADDQSFFITRSGIDIIGDSPNRREMNFFRIVTGLEGTFDVMDRAWTWDVSYNFGKSNSFNSQSALNERAYGFAVDAITDPRTGEPACRARVMRELVESGSATADQLAAVGYETFEDLSQAVQNQARTSNNAFRAIGADDAVQNCIPLNLIGQGQSSDEAIANLQAERTQTSEQKQQVMEVNIAGDVLDLPAGPVPIAFGAFHRREFADFQIDTLTSQTLDTFSAGTEVTGKFNTYELYGETLIPLISGGEGLPFVGEIGFIDSLELEGAIRFVDNNRSGNNLTWTAGGRLRFNLPLVEDGLQFRGNFTRSVRSPSVRELFQPQAQVNVFANDPCDPRFINGGPDPDTRRANCLQQFTNLAGSLNLPQPVQDLVDQGNFQAAFDLFREGDPALGVDQFQSIITNASQPAIQGGNPDLDSEVADSYTVGAVFQPPQLPGLTLTVDWTKIDIQNAIQALSGTQLLQACFDSPDFPDAQACSSFTRNPTSFQVQNPFLAFDNVARRTFAGLVATLNYNFEARELPLMDHVPGTFNLTGQFLHTKDSFISVLEGLAGFNRFDRERSRESLALVMQLNLQYTVDRFSFLWQTRYWSGGVFSNEDAPNFRDVTRFDDQTLYNMTLGYQFTDNFRGRLIINNVFDSKDPLTVRAANGGGNAQNNRDALGRRIIVGITSSF